jgi:vacuolar-type H+-ATPase subunit H
MPAATSTSRARRAGAPVADPTAEEDRSVASEAAGEAQQIASSAAERGGALVQQATEDARQLADTVKTRAGEVTGDLLGSGRSLVEDARYQLRSEAMGSAERLAGTFRGLGEEVQALAEGRPEEAPTIAQYVWRAADGFYGAADRVYAVAEGVQERGVSGVLDDVQSFARRRPGAFLLGAAVIGFGVGRYVKAEAAERKELQAAEEALAPNAGRAPVAARTARR